MGALTAAGRWVDIVARQLEDDVAFGWYAVLAVESADRLVVVVERVRNLPAAPAPPDRLIVPIDGSLGGAVLRSGRPAVVDDAWQIVYEPLIPHEIRGLLAVPVAGQDEPIGVVIVGNSRPGALGIADLDRLVAAVAAAVASAPDEDPGLG